ncbi:MAG TPA: heliorhodopsin HeR [Patescibacteria group bacterium]|nr:heliorhodopsin HeR [Patescibacteria group bacterium]
MATETTKKTTKTTKNKAPATSKVSAKATTSTKVDAKKNGSAPATVTKFATKKPSLSVADKLKRLSGWFALGYLVQAVAVVTVGTHAAAPVTASYLAVDTLASDAAGHQVVAGAAHHLVDVRLSWVLAAYLVVLAAVQVVFTVAKPAWRENMLTRGFNELRTLALALGGGLMVLAIALLGGVTDVTLLALLTASTAGGALVLLATEDIVANNEGKKTRLSRYTCTLAVIGMVLPWLAFAGTVAGSLMFNGHIPGYLWGIYASMLVLFSGIATAMHKRLFRRGKWADSAYAERMLMALLFVAATALTWQVYAGVLHS